MVRRGKWVVVTLAGHRGIIVIQPRMTGGFWLVEPDRPDHIRLVFHVEKPRAMVWYCDTRRLGKIGWYPDADEAAGAFARSHGPDALEIGRDELARAAHADGPRDQADLDGPEGAGGDRQYLRRRDAAPRSDPSRAAGPRRSRAAELDRLHRAIGEVLATAIAPGGLELRRGLSDGPRPRRGLPGPELRLRPRGPALPDVRAADREDEDRRADRPADLLLPALPEEVNRLSYFRGTAPRHDGPSPSGEPGGFRVG